MSYEGMSVEQLEELRARLHKQETEIHAEFSEATRVLRIKEKMRAADETLEEAQERKKALSKELEPSWIDRLRAKVGL